MEALNPSQELPALCFHLILASLDSPRDLVSAMLVNHDWYTFSISPKLWEAHTQNIWATLSYVPSNIREMKDSRMAFLASIKDASRVEITKEELCLFTWEFRFREGHPFDGMNFGLPRLQRFFHHDHVMTAPKGDPLQAGHPNHTWAFRAVPHTSSEAEDLARTASEFVQVSQFPFLRVSRTPKGGWKMENLWVLVESDHTSGPNLGHGEEGETDHSVILSWMLAGLHAGAHYDDEEEDEDEAELNGDVEMGAGEEQGDDDHNNQA